MLCTTQPFINNAAPTTAKNWMPFTWYFLTWIISAPTVAGFMPSFPTTWAEVLLRWKACLSRDKKIPHLAGSVLQFHFSKTSLVQPFGQSRHQIHAFMQNRHDQSRCTFTRQGKCVVVFAVRHQQLRVKVAHVPVCALTGRKARNPALQSADIHTHLLVTPLLARVADDPTQVGFSLKRKNVGAAQTRLSPDNSSSRMSPMFLLETLPARPSLMRAVSTPLSSCHAGSLSTLTGNKRSMAYCLIVLPCKAANAFRL